MATKKQKREALEEKRRLDLAETQAAGLLALERDRKRRARQQAAAKKRQEEQEAIKAAAKKELARLESEAIYEQYLKEEAAAKAERARCAMRAMAPSHG